MKLQLIISKIQGCKCLTNQTEGFRVKNPRKSARLPIGLYGSLAITLKKIWWFGNNT